MPESDARRSAIRVRPERPGDAESIRRVHDGAFGGPIEGRIVDDLRGTEWWLPWGSLVAEDRDGRIIGHLLASRALLAMDGKDRGQPVLVIGPVGVLPGEQRRGVGAALMRAAIDAATGREEALICLLGHADYYPRFGFVPARGLGVQPPRAWPDASWMALPLAAWAPDMRGTVRFPPAFPEE
jgi:putative acetyltransferase